ncbi:hypothetical protein B0H13DRAFT_1916959 [Mycena leptocephala]|nr:hypothetical protein B0H13DRAFT_1916959 [Mycena leptocephala]
MSEAHAPDEELPASEEKCASGSVSVVGQIGSASATKSQSTASGATGTSSSPAPSSSAPTGGATRLDIAWFNALPLSSTYSFVPWEPLYDDTEQLSSKGDGYDSNQVLLEAKQGFNIQVICLPEHLWHPIHEDSFTSKISFDTGPGGMCETKNFNQAANSGPRSRTSASTNNQLVWVHKRSAGVPFPWGLNKFPNLEKSKFNRRTKQIGSLDLRHQEWNLDHPPTLVQSNRLQVKPCPPSAERLAPGPDPGSDPLETRSGGSRTSKDPYPSVVTPRVREMAPDPPHMSSTRGPRGAAGTDAVARRPLDGQKRRKYSPVPGRRRGPSGTGLEITPRGTRTPSYCTKAPHATHGWTPPAEGARTPPKRRRPQRVTHRANFDDLRMQNDRLDKGYRMVPGRKNFGGSFPRVPTGPHTYTRRHPQG